MVPQLRSSVGTRPTFSTSTRSKMHANREPCRASSSSNKIVRLFPGFDHSLIMITISIDRSAVLLTTCTGTASNCRKIYLHRDLKRTCSSLFCDAYMYLRRTVYEARPRGTRYLPLYAYILGSYRYLGTFKTTLRSIDLTYVDLHVHVPVPVRVHTCMRSMPPRQLDETTLF